MSDLTETSTFEPGVYQLETSDPVLGGPGGISNLQPQQLANRTRYLKDRVDALETAAPGMASIAYVQSELEKLDGKQSARAATVAAISLSGLQTIDGVTLNSGDRVLVKDQTLASQNGIYVVAGSGWPRAVDANDSADITPGLEITIEEGTANGDSRWRLISDGPLILGTSQLLFQNVSFGLATLQSPTFTGDPRAPTPPSGDKDTSLATTAFVFNAIDGIQSISVAGGSDVVLTAAQAGSGILKFTGALSANINVVFPTDSGQWIIENNTSGTFNLTVKHSATGGVVVPQGFAVVVYSDGTTMKFASSTSQVSFTSTPQTPAAGTTSFVVLGGYTPGNVMVEKNGILLQPSEYTATDGANITGLTPTIAGDTFTIYAFRSFEVANHVLRSGDAMAGPLLLAANSTTPNVTAGDNSDKVANTAFVGTAIANATGRLIARRVFNTTQVYTPTPGTAFVDVTVVAGGGSGGGTQATGAGQSAVGGGGGGGGWARKRIASGFSGVTITVGLGGAVAVGVVGNSGGSSSFGALVSATGGTGGTVGTPSPNTTTVATGIGAPGQGSGGDVNFRGGQGNYGIIMVTPTSGKGGFSFGGEGGTWASGYQSGGSGSVPGAGGGGASADASKGAATGGNGADGIVIVEEYA